MSQHGYDADSLLLSLALRHGLVAPEVGRALHAEKLRSQGRTSFDALLSRMLAPQVLTQLRYEVRLSLAGSSPPAPTVVAALTPPPPGSPLPAPTVVAGYTPPPPGSALPVAPFRPERGARFGRYVLEEELGRGGMGVVWKARQTDLERTVALKMMLAEGAAASRRGRERFQSEARAAAKLQHPSIVAIHDVGEHQGFDFFTMDFVEGRTLAEIARKSPTEERVIEIAIALADALDYAHKRSVVHRDLKPANVIVDKAGRPRILDFGVAKDLTRKDGNTVAGEIVGTPNYMPPEQADGRVDEIGPRSDLYSLGAILYELLTKKPPFTGDSPFDIVKNVLEQPPVPPRKVDKRISKSMEAIVLRLLAKDPDDRYPNAEVLARDLARLRDGAPLERGPQGGETKLLIAGGVALLALAIGALALAVHVRNQEPAVALPGDPQPTDAPVKGDPTPTPRKSPAAELLEQARERRRAGGDPAAIEADLRRCLALEPGLVEARLELGSLALSQGDLAEARRELDLADAKPPADARAREALSDLRAKVDEERRAQEAVLAEASQSRRGFRMHEALAKLEAAAKKRPRSGTIRQELARALAAHGRAREAFSVSQEATKLDPTLGAWLPEEAESDLKKDLALDERPAGTEPLSKLWEPLLGGAFGEQKDELQGSGYGIGPFSLAVLIRSDTQPASSYKAGVELSLESENAAFAGIVFAAKDPDDYYLAYVFHNPEEVKRIFGAEKVDKLHEKNGAWPKSLRIARMVAGKWQGRTNFLVSFPDRGFVRLEVSVAGGTEAQFKVGESTSKLELDRVLDGRCGVMKFYNSSVRFRNWEWSAR